MGSSVSRSRKRSISLARKDAVVGIATVAAALATPAAGATQAGTIGVIEINKR